ncbi:MAG: hypothetical protein J7484_14085 [Microbacterium sp.]|nr:hypothetical protein [Microbacterium sp.]
MTMVEVLVAMLLTGIVLAIMIPAMLPYIKYANSSKVRSTSTSDAQIVFERIDSEVRFASTINQQGYGASTIANPNDASVIAEKARYIEWLTPAESSPTGKAFCTQWRFVPATNAIEERQWNLDSIPPTTFTQRLELAIDQKPDATLNQNVDAWDRPIYPFAMSSASASGRQPLQSLTLWVYAGQSESAATTQIKTKFVARNSEILSITNDNADTGWGQVPADGYGDPQGHQDSVAGRKVPLVCNASVRANGTYTSWGTGVFRP